MIAWNSCPSVFTFSKIGFWSRSKQIVPEETRWSNRSTATGKALLVPDEGPRPPSSSTSVPPWLLLGGCLPGRSSGGFPGPSTLRNHRFSRSAQTVSASGHQPARRVGSPGEPRLDESRVRRRADQAGLRQNRLRAAKSASPSRSFPMICSATNFFPSGIHHPPLVCAARDSFSEIRDVEGRAGHSSPLGHGLPKC